MFSYSIQFNSSHTSFIFTLILGRFYFNKKLKLTRFFKHHHTKKLIPPEFAPFRDHLFFIATFLAVDNNVIKIVILLFSSLFYRYYLSFIFHILTLQKRHDICTLYSVFLQVTPAVISTISTNFIITYERN